MKPLKNLTLAAATLVASGALPGVAQASPSAFTSKCGAITLKNDTPSTLMRDTEDCRLIWVLPPNAGTTQLSGFSPSGNLNLCSNVKTLQKSSENVLVRIDQLAKKASEIQPELDAAIAKKNAALAKVAESLKKDGMAQIDSMQLELTTLQVRIDGLLESIDKCKNNCDNLQSEYRAATKQRADLTIALARLRAQHSKDVRDYDFAKARLDAAQQELDDVGSSIDKLNSKQAQYHTDLMNLLLAYSRFEGGFAHMDYNTGWDEAVQRLSAQYSPSYQFRKIDTKDARIFANLVGAANEATYLSSMPAILDYNIDGLKYLPFGEEKMPEQSAYPSHLSGAIRMSLIGACPLYYTNFLTSSTLVHGTVPDSWNFAISATYKYPAAYHLDMKASYNLYKFYEKIVSSSSSGGFFSSHTATSISESSLSTDTFKIDWNVEDPDSKYGEAERQAIAKELKADLIGRVLNDMAQPVFDKLATPGVPGNQGHGALVLADGLQNTCGMVNVWCAAGVWVLRGLNSIFGSDSATNSFRSTNDHTATEQWHSTYTRWNPGVTLFTSLKQ